MDQTTFKPLNDKVNGTSDICSDKQQVGTGHSISSLPQNPPPPPPLPPAPVTEHVFTIEPMDVPGGNQQIQALGNCPSCRVGFVEKKFDICGILLAILFFPIGILCCFCMMKRRCSHCRSRF